MTSTYAVQVEPNVATTNDALPVVTAGIATIRQAGLIAVLPEAVEVTYAEGADILDRAARRKLGISGDEFIRLWDSGTYNGDEENVEAQEVAMLLPFARPEQKNAR